MRNFFLGAFTFAAALLLTVYVLNLQNEKLKIEHDKFIQQQHELDQQAELVNDLTGQYVELLNQVEPPTDR